MPFDSDTDIGGAHRRFPTTLHSLIHSAAGTGTMAREALDSIIAVYWKPAYKHVRIQWKRSNEEAKDLVQGFFAALIEQEILAGFDSSKARFRTYLKGCLDHYVMKQDESANRLKRGGGTVTLFDFDAAERELAGAPSVEDVFLREWQREMFALALHDLRERCTTIGKPLHYRIFEQYDLADACPPQLCRSRRRAWPPGQLASPTIWPGRGANCDGWCCCALSSVTSGDRECQAELRVLFGS